MCQMMTEKGQATVEYALIIGIISVAALIVLLLVGTGIGNVVTNVATTINP